MFAPPLRPSSSTSMARPPSRARTLSWSHPTALPPPPSAIDSYPDLAEALLSTSPGDNGPSLNVQEGGPERPLSLDAVTKHPKLRLEIVSGSTIFRAGGEITGRLEVGCSASKGLRLGEIGIEVEGVEELTSRDHAATQSFLFSHLLFQGEHLPPSNAVLPSAPTGGYWTARKGKTTFPFALKIPLTSPSSVVFAGNACLRYTLKATAQCWWNDSKSVVTARRDAFVVEQWHDQFNPIYKQPIEVVGDTRVFMGGHGAIWLEAGLTERLFWGGGTMIVRIGVKNNTRRTISGVKVNLARRLVFPTASSSSAPPSAALAPQITEVVSESKFHGREYEFAAGTEAVTNVNVEVHKDLRTIRKTKTFEVQCLVLVSLMLGTFAKDLTVEIPVYVAHTASIQHPAEATLDDLQPHLHHHHHLHPHHQYPDEFAPPPPPSRSYTAPQLSGPQSANPLPFPQPSFGQYDPSGIPPPSRSGSAARPASPYGAPYLSASPAASTPPYDPQAMQPAVSPFQGQVPPVQQLAQQDWPQAVYANQAPRPASSHEIHGPTSVGEYLPSLQNAEQMYANQGPSQQQHGMLEIAPSPSSHPSPLQQIASQQRAQSISPQPTSPQQFQRDRLPIARASPKGSAFGITNEQARRLSLSPPGKSGEGRNPAGPVQQQDSPGPRPSSRESDPGVTKSYLPPMPMAQPVPHSQSPAQLQPSSSPVEPPASPMGLSTIDEYGESQAGTIRSVKPSGSLAGSVTKEEVAKLEALADAEEEEQARREVEVLARKMGVEIDPNDDKPLPVSPLLSERQRALMANRPKASDLFNAAQKQGNVEASRSLSPQGQRARAGSLRSEEGLQALENRLSRSTSPAVSAASLIPPRQDSNGPAHRPTSPLSRKRSGEAWTLAAVGKDKDKEGSALRSEAEKRKQKEKELALERERQKERDAELKRRMERERAENAEMERRERERLLERQRKEAEMARERKLELERERQLERQREAERQRRRDEERRKEREMAERAAAALARERKNSAMSAVADGPRPSGASDGKRSAGSKGGERKVVDPKEAAELRKGAVGRVGDWLTNSPPSASASPASPVLPSPSALASIQRDAQRNFKPSPSSPPPSASKAALAFPQKRASVSSTASSLRYYNLVDDGDDEPPVLSADLRQLIDGSMSSRRNVGKALEEHPFVRRLSTGSAQKEETGSNRTTSLGQPSSPPSQGYRPRARVESLQSPSAAVSDVGVSAGLSRTKAVRRTSLPADAKHATSSRRPEPEGDGEDPSQIPSSVRAMLLTAPALLSKYDVRSARGGRGGRVTSAASLWAERLAKEKEEEVKPVVVKPKALNVGPFVDFSRSSTDKIVGQTSRSNNDAASSPLVTSSPPAIKSPKSPTAHLKSAPALGFLNTTMPKAQFSATAATTTDRSSRRWTVDYHSPGSAAADVTGGDVGTKAKAKTKAERDVGEEGLGGKALERMTSMGGKGTTRAIGQEKLRELKALYERQDGGLAGR